MTNRAVVEEKVRQLVAANRGCRPESLQPETSLFHDLGMCGDDVDVFFSAYQREFKTDASAIVGEHFPGEGMDLRPWRLWREVREPTRYFPITVQDLVDGAVSGRLTYDYERREPYSVSPLRWRVLWAIVGTGAFVSFCALAVLLSLALIGRMT